MVKAFSSRLFLLAALLRLIGVPTVLAHRSEGGLPATATVVGSITLPGNSRSIVNTYDSVARLQTTSLTFAGTAINFHQYDYDHAGQIRKQTRLRGDSVGYTYDNAGQLKSATGTEPDGVTPRLNEQFGYTYDPAGNLATRTENALVETFSPNNLNQLGNPVTASGTVTVAGSFEGTQVSSVSVNGTSGSVYGCQRAVKTSQGWADENRPL